MSIRIYNCVKCHHEWSSKGTPKRCPSCDTKHFDGSPDRRTRAYKIKK